MTHLVYIVGAPAVGKSTLLWALTGYCWREPCITGVAHSALWAPSQRVRDGEQSRVLALELGKQRGEYSGTDALPFNVQPPALRWLATRPHPLVVGEGDRLGNISFLRALREDDIRCTLVHLSLPEDVLAQRWKTWRHRQDPAWRAGRATKAANTATAWAADGEQVITLDGTTDPLTLAARLRDQVPDLTVLPPLVAGLPLPPAHLWEPSLTLLPPLVRHHISR